MLCSATTKRLNDANDVPIVKQKQKLLELFGRLSSLVVNDWQVYWYYAEIVLSLATVSSGEDCNSNEIELDNQSAEKYFGLLLKAFRNLYNQNNWELSVDKCREVVYNSTEILKSKKLIMIKKNMVIIFFFVDKKDVINMQST